MANKKTKKPESFEAAIDQLEVIVKKLESGELPLAEALTSFQEGIELSRYCQQTLDQAEETVAKMMTDQGSVLLNEAK